jgi:hypothetical protein
LKQAIVVVVAQRLSFASPLGTSGKSSQAFHLLSHSKTNLKKDVDSFALLDCFA